MVRALVFFFGGAWGCFCFVFVFGAGSCEGGGRGGGSRVGFVVIVAPPPHDHRGHGHHHHHHDLTRQNHHHPPHRIVLRVFVVVVVVAPNEITPHRPPLRPHPGGRPQVRLRPHAERPQRRPRRPRPSTHGPSGGVRVYCLCRLSIHTERITKPYCGPGKSPDRSRYRAGAHACCTRMHGCVSRESVRKNYFFENNIRA